MGRRLHRRLTATRQRFTASSLRAALPEGRLLHEREWRRRHGWIVAVLWLHAPALVLWGLLAGLSPVSAAVHGAVVAPFAVLASTPRLGRRLRTAAAALGLMACSAVAVDIPADGLPGQFHFFVAVSILALYQDWLPFLLAIGFVIVHHGLLGGVGATVGSDHPMTAAAWRGGLLHAAFILAASVASVVSWRASEQLLRDPLTGLAGRLLYVDRLGLALARLRRRPRTAVAVLFVDLDRFKAINDTHGHAAGDAILVHVAEALRSTLRAGDTVARFGGDEFAAICPDVQGELHAVAIAERLQRAIARSVVVGGLPESTSASIGVALAHEEVDAEALIHAADAAMYRAKARGGATCEVVGWDAPATRAADRAAA